MASSNVNNCTCEEQGKVFCKICSRLKMWWSDAENNNNAWYSTWNDEKSKPTDSALATAMYARWQKKYGYSFYPIFYLNREPNKPKFGFIENKLQES
jgi:hypothetical protein